MPIVVPPPNEPLPVPLGQSLIEAIAREMQPCGDSWANVVGVCPQIGFIPMAIPLKLFRSCVSRETPNHLWINKTC
jgi:hypothetical protein